ncbi:MULTISPECIES: hypothetical protein [unclassified Pseudonocardia]|uniref:hypothetical protein n=1 Tax=unclassified Pseudonocardia TaxID=2619320 RepID=UPI0001FFDFEF|nr:hypothetical protein [Pseudonocardia sp. Ae707_Ps1]
MPRLVISIISAVALAGALVLAAPVASASVPAAQAAPCAGVNNEDSNTYFGAGGGQITTYTGQLDSCLVEAVRAQMTEVATAQGVLAVLTSKVPGVGWTSGLAGGIAAYGAAKLGSCALGKTGVNVTMNAGIVSCSPQ